MGVRLKVTKIHYYMQKLGDEKSKNLDVSAAEPEEAGRVLILAFTGIWPGRSTGF